MLEIGSAAATADDGGRGVGGHSGGFGLVLRGGTQHDSDRTRPLIVSRVIPQSPANRLTTHNHHVSPLTPMSPVTPLSFYLMERFQ